jgi:hypothetical protein
LIALLSLSCSEPRRGESSWRGSIDTLASGAVHVRNPEQGVWAVGEGWKLVEELRIGSVSGDTPDGFSQVAAIGVSPSGQIHVIDEHAQEVRVFAPSGEHVRSFGRRGSGPGEFTNAYSFNWDVRGRLWISDPGNNRYAVYDTAGTLLVHVTRAVPGVVFPWLGGIGRDGYLYDVAVTPGADGVSDFTFYRIDADGAIVSALPPIDQPQSGRRLPSLTLLWLTPRRTFAFDERGYFWLANTGDYQITQRSFEGDTVRIVSRAYTPTPVSQAERDSIRRQLQSAPPESRDPPIPDVRPAIERIFVDREGILYVRAFGDDAEPDRGFDVFDAAGRFLGNLRSDVPLSMFPALPQFVNGSVYGVTTDSLGVSYVVRARIEK